MRRLRIPLIILATVIVAMLFFGDFLTGRENREFQDPYSRAKRVMGSRFGLPHESIMPNEMTDFYYASLKQPRVYRWEASANSFRVERGTGAMKFDDTPIAPVMFLDPQIEVAFLRELSTDAQKIAVVRSLFTPRKPAHDPQASAWNKAVEDRERTRVRRIVGWYEIERNNYAVPFTQWWRDNAHVFGVTPEGTPIPVTALKKQP